MRRMIVPHTRGAPSIFLFIQALDIHGVGDGGATDRLHREPPLVCNSGARDGKGKGSGILRGRRLRGDPGE